MTTPRSQQIDLEITPYYHCMSRCVRRAYLCGEDSQTGQNYDHRKDWIESRMKHLSHIFGIKICSYAVMSNHYHMVLYVDRESVLQWSEEEVLDRWGTLCPFDKAKIQQLQQVGVCVQERLEVIRERLSNISWFMRAMNEWIARESNLEDNCAGRFWEKRFKSQALLDEGAVLTAMAYVDLNSIRAGIAKTPEASDYTSVKTRIEALGNISEKEDINMQPQPADLMPFQQAGLTTSQIPFKLSDYLTLVDQTGRSIRNDKKGFIPTKLSPILERLQLKPEAWTRMVKSLEKEFSHAVGSQASIRLFSFKQSKRAPKGFAFSKKMYQLAS
jgi:REP element-mobilizing transposase RayT